MNVNRLGRGLLAAAALLVMSGGAWAGIANTKHNLGSTGSGPNTFSGTDEICVFCHTPHGADTSANPPLWNRTLPQSSTFTTYDSLGTTTLDGEVLSVGSVSIACLSCHDGTQAMNVMINAPNDLNGSGTWSGPAGTANPVGSLNYNSTATGNPLANLGNDLTDDHPIGIEYAGGGCSTQPGTCNPEGGATADPDFQDALRTGPSVATWYVDTGGAGRQKTDMILYTRQFGVAGDGTGGAAGPSVECATCHDPHTETATFLRIQNTGSAVCLACHIK